MQALRWEALDTLCTERAHELDRETIPRLNPRAEIWMRLAMAAANLAVEQASV